MSYDVIDGRYFTGCLVPDKKPERLALYESSQPMLTLAEITELISNENRTPARQRFPAGQWIRNQGGRGSCNGYAGAWALSRARVIAGLPFVPLSGEFLYSMINGGVDRGSMLDDGMKAIQERGVARESLVKHESYLWSQMSQEARADAASHMAFECYRVESELGLASGLALGFVGVVAVHASNAWSSLSGGVSRPSNGPGNHAVVCQDVRSNGSQLQFDIANSWGQRWGDNGHTWNTWKDHFIQTVGYHDFYLIRGVTDDPQDPVPEPKE
jgi:hypothetical protein